MMVKCKYCNIDMNENTDLHTNFVGGAAFEEQVFLTYPNDKEENKRVFGIFYNVITKRVKARFCPKCGLVEFYIDINDNK